MGTVITEITPLSDKDCFYLIDRFYDHEYGGVYWSVAADGTPADTHKQFYALGFAIYGLAEYVPPWVPATSEAAAPSTMP